MPVADYIQEARRLSKLLDDALSYVRGQASEAAQAENDYRKAKSVAWVEAPEGTVPEREAYVNGVTADARQRRDLAESLLRAGFEAVKSRRQQLSVLQTVVNADREEAAYTRTGPEGRP